MRRIRDAADRADGATCVRPARGGLRPGFNGPIPIVIDVNGDEQALQRVFDGVQALGEQGDVASVGEPQFND